MRIRSPRRSAQRVQDTRSNPPHGGPMSIWSCARHNGMTGAGSDRDAGPTPVQRARFRGECPRKRRSVRICWRRLESTRCTPGRQQRAVWTRREGYICVSRAPLPPSTVSLAPRQNGVTLDVPAPYGFAERAFVPEHPARSPASASLCSRPAADASRYNARRVD
jgi:hypothetical protein